ncbi:hypothetical protein PoB_006090700 [Plakobranchus ocellatus]|uniref:Uncharacterized protein n=1 Tax=Plakobranchus ocellatus TaxID=259542 RepID=A0AAV4CR91_9GAST|nr:hypothetical protein PoB_006090700 [Plakobranchus ocellatus]
MRSSYEILSITLHRHTFLSLCEISFILSFYSLFLVQVLLPSPGLVLRITDSRLSRSPENQRTGTSMSSLFQFWNTGVTAGIPIPGVSGCGILRYHCLISS